jgi:hypothetical protein
MARKNGMSIEDRDYLRRDYKKPSREKEGVSLALRIKFFLWRLLRRLRGQNP